jgi:hypothetical protein
MATATMADSACGDVDCMRGRPTSATVCISGVEWLVGLLRLGRGFGMRRCRCACSRGTI